MGPSALKVASRFLAKFSPYPVRDMSKEEEDEELNAWREKPVSPVEGHSGLPGQDDEDEPYQNEEQMWSR